MGQSPAVLLLDDGELDDVQTILDDCQISYGRVRGGAIVPKTPAPRRLLITTPRRIEAVQFGDAQAADLMRIVVVVFVTRRSAFQRRLGAATRAIFPAGGLWIAWPKQASGVATDLTGNLVRKFGLDREWVDYKIAAIDATWSGLRFARRKPATGAR